MDTITINKKRYVLVPEAVYERMAKTPETDDEGNALAIPFADAAIARTIVRRRKAAGLSQKELAKLAGIRVEILNRAERAAVTPSMRTLTKIELALRKCQAKKP